MNTAESDRPALVRAISRRQLVAISINDVIGSGVYLLPAAAALLLGPTSILGVVLTGLAVALLVLCFAEASSYFDQAGGAYLYTREAFGSFVGFEVGWMTVLARIASIASLSNGFALAMAFLWEPAGRQPYRAIIIFALLGLLTWINVQGVRHGARTAVSLLVAKTVPLVIFVVIGIFFVEWSRVTAMEAPPPGSLGEASLLLLFAYVGFENTPAAAGEYKNPKRDVPFALLAMITLVTVLYTGVQTVAIGVLPGVENSLSPVAESAGVFMGAAGALLMSLGAMISIGGNVGNTILVGPRYVYALARDGYGPSVLGRVHPRYNTPAAAIVALSAVALVLSLTGTFVQLAMLSVIARMVTYIGTAAALPMLRKKFGAPPNAVRLPGGATIPVLAIALSIALLTSASLNNLLAGGAALAAGALIYRFRRQPEPF